MAQRRLGYCIPCEFRKMFLCNKCGCVLQAKARLIDETCPADKWPKIFHVESLSETKNKIDEALRNL